MRLPIITTCLMIAATVGCTEPKMDPAGQPVSNDQAQAWPKDLSGNVGQTISLEGIAANAKLGAILMGNDQEIIWIDGLHSWPEGYYSEGDKGKRLRVTGKLIRRDDLPVFVQKPGEFPPQGMPVQSEKELEEAKWRFLLEDAKWTVLE